jgi:hypothetical protein
VVGDTAFTRAHSATILFSAPVFSGGENMPDIFSNTAKLFLPIAEIASSVKGPERLEQ